MVADRAPQHLKIGQLLRLTTTALSAVSATLFVGSTPAIRSIEGDSIFLKVPGKSTEAIAPIFEKLIVARRNKYPLKRTKTCPHQVGWRADQGGG